MVSFEIFVKTMPPSLSELKVLPSFCFAFKIPDDRAVTNMYGLYSRAASNQERPMMARVRYAFVFHRP
jgi:hypothetical protein